MPKPIRPRQDFPTPLFLLAVPVLVVTLVVLIA
jgi:hypothetical protein